MGDATKQTIYDIWHGPEAKLLRNSQLNGCYTDIGICNKCYVPYTELDGQVISIDSVHKEVKEIAKKERTRWITDDLELSPKAEKRFNKANKK